jgi:tellurite resistance protein TerB
MALKWLKDQLNSIQGTLKGEMTRFKNTTLLEGIVAGCAAVAYADGVASPEEKQKMMGFIRQSEALSVYDTNKVIELFNKYMGKYEFDTMIGKAEAMQAIGRVKKPEEARLLVRVCCMIGAADGNFDDNERALVTDICRELNLNPKDFDL